MFDSGGRTHYQHLRTSSDSSQVENLIDYRRIYDEVPNKKFSINRIKSSINIAGR